MPNKPTVLSYIKHEIVPSAIINQVKLNSRPKFDLHPCDIMSLGRVYCVPDFHFLLLLEFFPFEDNQT